MKLKSVKVYVVKISFKQSFKHASANRTFARNIIVSCADSNGIAGWGESMAREYVTGETLEGTVKRYKNIQNLFLQTQINTPDDIQQLLKALRIDKYNAAKCALEIALFDLLARSNKKPLFEYCNESLAGLSSSYEKQIFFYGGAIGLSGLPKTILNALKMKIFGFKYVKIKLEKNINADKKRLFWIRLILGGKIDIRVDANEAWDIAYAKEITPFLKQYKISSIEQPFPKTSIEDNRKLRDYSGLPIILDESLCSLRDAQTTREKGYGDIYCVKLPKVGGIFNALKIFGYCKKNKIPIQLSCQVGESAILSAASRHIAALCPTLKYLEGSFDKYLLKDNVIEGDISFGYGGKACMLTGYGLGINVNPEKVEKLAQESFVLL
ncbi:hypothetical protein J7L67_06150 [bacterium]|nr:hypothetical protein [bacterium]